MAAKILKFQPALTKEEIPADLHKRVVEKLTVARVQLLLKNPFFGYLSIRMPLVAADGWVDTAATDGKRFYFNHSFVDAITDAEAEFLVGHETLHVVYEHGVRQEKRIHSLWNSATDYAINLDLVEHKIGTLITTIPILYDTAYREQSGEDIYEQLFKKFAADLKGSIKNGNDGSAGRAQTGNPALNDILNSALDDILSNDKENSKTDPTGKDGPVPMSGEERAALRDEIREAIINAAKNCAAGDIPAGAQRLIGQFTAPTINWRELLRAQLESIIVGDYSWLRPSRIGWDLDAVLPGMEREKFVDVCIAIDASGSMSEKMLRDFLSEVAGIMDQFNQFKIQIWTFDTKVYNPQTFTSENLEDLANYKIQGGGGTSFDANWEYMKENNIQPERFIMMTDGYPCNGWGDENYCDTVFILHGTDSIVPPFGVHTYYQEESK